MNTREQKATMTALEPSNGRKSFYGKAKVLETKDAHYLKSYDTIVASVTRSGEVRRHSEWISRTTACHVKSFLAQFAPVAAREGFRALPVSGRPGLVVMA